MKQSRIALTALGDTLRKGLNIFISYFNSLKSDKELITVPLVNSTSQQIFTWQLRTKGENYFKFRSLDKMYLIMYKNVSKFLVNQTAG